MADTKREATPMLLLTLRPSYFQQGSFNVPKAFDNYVRSTAGPVRLRLGIIELEIEAQVNRRVNKNGTARVFGRQPLRDWFKRNCTPMDVLVAEFTSSTEIALYREQDKK